MSDPTFVAAALLTTVAFPNMQFTVKAREERNQPRLWTDRSVGPSEGLLGFHWMGYFLDHRWRRTYFFPRRRINGSMTMISMALLDRDGCTVFTTRWCSGGVTMFWSDVGRIQKVWLDSWFRLPLVFCLVVIPLIAVHPSSNSLTPLIKSPWSLYHQWNDSGWMGSWRWPSGFTRLPRHHVEPWRPGWWNLTWMIFKMANKPSQHFCCNVSLCFCFEVLLKAADRRSHPGTCMVVSRYWMSR